MDTFGLADDILPERNQQNAQEASETPVPEGAQKFQRAISAWRGIFDSGPGLSFRVSGDKASDKFMPCRYRFYQHDREVRCNRIRHCCSAARYPRPEEGLGPENKGFS